MTKQQLESISGWFHASPWRIPALKAVNGVCVYSAVAAFAYGVLLRPGFHDPKLTLRLILTCGVPFVLLSAVRSREDSGTRMEENLLGQAATGLWESDEALIAALDAVTPERVAAAARSMTLDTVYFLRGEDETND